MYDGWAWLKSFRARAPVDLIISTPLRLVASLQAGNLELDK